MSSIRLLAWFIAAAWLPAQQWVSVDGPRVLGGNAVFDAARARAVVFGVDGELWEFEGALPLHRPVPDGQPRPVARSHPAMVFDAARGHVLVFGGLGRQGALGDTWAWDGLGWRALSSTITPPRRHGAAIAFDPTRGRVVMFGGVDLAPLGDTWEHDGASWRRQLPATDPMPVTWTRMVFDPTRGRCLLLQGDPSLGRAQLAEWDGANWTILASQGGSVPDGNAAGFAFDPMRQRAVLAGGSSGAVDVWEWDGARWAAAGSAPQLARAELAAWFDPGLGEVVFAGGQTARLDVGFSAWRWDGARAQQVLADGLPAVDSGANWLWDAGASEAVRLGQAASGQLEAWAWSGSGWRQRTAGQQPPARRRAAVAVDLPGRRALLFGGVAGTQFVADLWSLSSGSWSALPGATPPPARTNAAMAFDAARGELVLFGGSAQVAFGDTWLHNGAGWRQVTTAVAPAPRYWHAMAFDAARARTVLFGGESQGRFSAETWEWDGARWAQVITTRSPQQLSSMVYDVAAARVVVSVSRPVSLPVDAVTHELWQYDGADWQLVDQRGAPNPGQWTSAAHLVYDDVRDCLVAFEGAAVREWTTRAASVAVVGQGCGAPAVSLAARARPRIGEAQFGLEVATDPLAVALIALSDSGGSLPLPGAGCVLHLGAIRSLQLFSVGPSGRAGQLVPVPWLPALRGFALHAQAAALPSGGAGFGLSPGLVLRVGD